MNGSMNPLRHCIEPSADVRLRQSCSDMWTIQDYERNGKTARTRNPISVRASFVPDAKLCDVEEFTSRQIGIRSAKMRHEPVREAVQGSSTNWLLWLIFVRHTH